MVRWVTAGDGTKVLNLKDRNIQQEGNCRRAGGPRDLKIPELHEIRHRETNLGHYPVRKEQSELRQKLQRIIKSNTDAPYEIGRYSSKTNQGPQLFHLNFSSLSQCPTHSIS